MTGKIKWFDAQKGFGFVTPNDGGKDLFVHHRSIEKCERSNGLKILNVNDEVEFQPTENERGPRAENVRLIKAAA